jgi:hypothetical protein
MVEEVGEDMGPRVYAFSCALSRRVCGAAAFETVREQEGAPVMRFSVKAAACAAVIVAGLLFASTAEARERHVSRTWTTHRGTYTASADLVRTRGFRSRNVQITGPNGGHRTVSDQRTWSRRDGTYTHERRVAFADGTSRSVDANAHRVSPGTWDYSRTVTGRNGETRTQRGTIVITKHP